MKNIIFDWSGVVKDAVTSQLWIVNRIFEKYGVRQISLEELKESWEQPHQLFYNKYLPKLSLEQESIDYKEAIFNKNCPKSKSFQGMADLIKELKKENHFLSVVTSDLAENIAREIKEYDLENIFDEIITDVYDKYEAISKLMKERNLSLDDTYFVGDSNHEIDISKKERIRSVAVTWGFCKEKKLKSLNPDYLVKSVKELGSILLS
ncbi:MAG TPA: HAD hydrolase-like protein [Candidatus Paceibacterota bacterium]